MESPEKEWTDFEKELEKFQVSANTPSRPVACLLVSTASSVKNAHKDYVKKLEEVESLKKSNLQQFLKHKKKLSQLKDNLEK